jgi:hypothetical protein
VQNQDSDYEREILEQRRHRPESLKRENLRDQTKHPVGRHAHQQHHELHDHGVEITEEFQQALARFSGQRQRKAEEPGEDDDLQHVALGHRLNRIRREQIDEHIRQRRSLLRFERSVGIEIESSTGLNDRGSDQRQRNRNRCGRQIETQRLHAHPTELRDIVQRCGAADQGNEDQRNDQQLQAGQKNRTTHVEQPVHHDDLDPAGGPDPIEQQANGESCAHSEHDLERQAAAPAPIGLHRIPRN